MLAVIPDSSKQYVDAGSDRLLELEVELNRVKKQLGVNEPRGVKWALNNLQKELRGWVKKHLQK